MSNVAIVGVGDVDVAGTGGVGIVVVEAMAGMDDMENPWSFIHLMLDQVLLDLFKSSVSATVPIQL